MKLGAPSPQMRPQCSGPSAVAASSRPRPRCYRPDLSRCSPSDATRRGHGPVSLEVARQRKLQGTTEAADGPLASRKRPRPVGALQLGVRTLDRKSGKLYLWHTAQLRHSDIVLASALRQPATRCSTFTRSALHGRSPPHAGDSFTTGWPGPQGGRARQSILVQAKLDLSPPPAQSIVLLDQRVAWSGHPWPAPLTPSIWKLRWSP